MHRLLFILLWFIVINIDSGYSQCTLKSTSYKQGEIIDYEVYYNWGFIWLNAGWVKFQVKDSVYNNKETLLFDSYGSSHESYDWLFKVRDQYFSHVDKESLKPVLFHRKNSEGGFELENKYVFNWDANVIYSETENSDKPYSKDTIDISPCTFDVLSMVYYTRNLDFTKIKVGEKVPMSSILDNEVFDLYIRYMGKETIKDREGRKYNCIKFSALLVEGSIFKGGEDMFVWVTDDENKVPVLVEAKILIGSVKAYLSGTHGLKH